MLKSDSKPEVPVVVGNGAISIGKVKSKHYKVSLSFASLSDQLYDSPSLF